MQSYGPGGCTTVAMSGRHPDLHHARIDSRHSLAFPVLLCLMIDG